MKKEFKNYIEKVAVSLVDKLNKETGKYYAYNEISVVKNNGKECNGFELFESAEDSENTIHAVFYLDDYFNDGSDIDEVVEIFYNEYINSSINYDDIKDFTDFEAIKDRLYACVINYEKNADIDAPYVKIGNLMICYRVLVKRDENSAVSLLVMNDLYNKWDINISSEDLLKLAYKNTKELLPPRYDFSPSLTRIISGAKNVIPFNRKCALEESHAIYEISNIANDRGAIYMLDQEILSDICNNLNSDKLIILPSSINEAFVTRYQDKESYEDMRESVKEVNSIVVPEEEYLSDTPYIYDNIKKEITYDDGVLVPFIS